MYQFVIDNEIALKLLDIPYADQLFKLIDSCRSYIKEWLPSFGGIKSIEDTKSFINIKKQQFASNSGVQAGIWYKGNLVGLIGFNAISWENKFCIICYWLGEGYQGNGIMTRSCKAFVDYAINGLRLNRVEIRCAEKNIRSRAIPERLAFVNEGIIREAELLNGHYVNHVVYSVLAREWS